MALIELDLTAATSAGSESKATTATLPAAFRSSTALAVPVPEVLLSAKTPARSGVLVSTSET